MFWRKCTYCKKLSLFSGKAELSEINELEFCREALAAGGLIYEKGNCLLEDTESVLQSETQYTVVHYFKCAACGQLLLLGYCIRGEPFFKKVEAIEPRLLS